MCVDLEKQVVIIGIKDDGRGASFFSRRFA